MNTPIIARDLAKQAPHSPRERVAGFVILNRAIDKCRASLEGTLGDYRYASPLDNLLFTFKRITAEQFKTTVQASACYEDIGIWLHANGAPRTAAEIKSWSDETEAASPMRNPEERSCFIQSCSVLGLNPWMNSTFDLLEADDRETFRAKPVQATKHKSIIAAGLASRNGRNE